MCHNSGSLPFKYRQKKERTTIPLRNYPKDAYIVGIPAIDITGVSVTSSFFHSRPDGINENVSKEGGNTFKAKYWLLILTIINDLRVNPK